MRTARVLYVEDYVPLRTLVADCLSTELAKSEQPWTVEWDFAATLAEAEEKVAESIDLLLVDLELPASGGRAGMRLIEAVRARAPAVPIIVLSGYLDCAAQCEAQCMGVRVVTKVELNIDAIVRLVRRELESPYEQVARTLAATIDPLPDKLEKVEAAIARHVLARCNRNLSEVARELGIDRRSVQRKLVEWEARPPARPPARPRKDWAAISRDDRRHPLA